MIMQLMLLIVTVSLTSSPARSLDLSLNDDVLGLIVFKAGLKDPNSQLESWSENDEDACNWKGVECDRRRRRVTKLILHGFSLHGNISRVLSRLRFLQTLSLSDNSFTGSIHPDLGSLPFLKHVDFSKNSLSGKIPITFFQQCRFLRFASFAENKLTGPVPATEPCRKLKELNLSFNELSGDFPYPLQFSRSLRFLDLSNNQFSGFFPEQIGRCADLEVVDLSFNSFFGNVSESLWNCKSIASLNLSRNRFSGIISSSIGNLTKLRDLNLSFNQFLGSLPQSLRNCSNLTVLDCGHNLLTGDLPSWIFDEMGLTLLSLPENMLTGSLQYLPSMAAVSVLHLQVLDLSSNSLSGIIPSTVGISRSMKLLNLSKNQLSGSVPSTIGEMDKLVSLDLSGNMLNGSIPTEIGKVTSLLDLKLEKNFLTGHIPSQIRNCISLRSLVLYQNNLTGEIPRELAELINLENVDLSFNYFSGRLPAELSKLTRLLSFNISHNNILGDLPRSSFFNNLPSSSVSGNPSLCVNGSHSYRSYHQKPIVLNPDLTNPDGRSRSSSSLNHRKKIVLSVSSLVAIGTAAMILLGILTVTILNFRVRRNARAPSAMSASEAEEFSCSSNGDPNYGKLVMFSGDAGFVPGTHALLNKDCELGRGGFGVVYRTSLRDGHSVATKKLTLLIKSQEKFEREARRLGEIRHHNLVSLEGYYWTPSLQLLFFQFVSCGTLRQHLHEDQTRTGLLPWNQRFSIILGVARALAHLHENDAVHCNLKSSNVLLNDSLEAMVGDFGLMRMFPVADQGTLSCKIQGALGYMAPELSSGTAKVSKKSDVYSFGVLVLEVVTGRRPVEYMEDDVVVLCDMVRGALEDGGLEDCVDTKLEGEFSADEAVPVIKLGLVCASHVPSDRPDMEEVVNILELIQIPSAEEDESERNDICFS